MACAASGRRAFLSAAAALALLPALAGCDRPAGPGVLVASGATVLALGDSLTHGTGAAPDAAYPAVLADLTGWKVVNAGIPGDTSAQALQRLPALLDEHRPKLVLVSIGGNDFLRRLPEADTRANIERIVVTAQALPAQVLLIAVPRPSLAAAFIGTLSDHALYAELADRLRVPLHAGGWAEVLGDERLKADAIHANAAGYRRFAEGLRTTARALGLLAR